MKEKVKANSRRLRKTVDLSFKTIAEYYTFFKTQVLKNGLKSYKKICITVAKSYHFSKL